MSKHTYDYNDERHEYRIDGRIVPSVTQILKDVLDLKYWNSTDWHMERGKAVHACAEMIAQGLDFDFDEQIAGQVAACKKWFADVKPVVRHVESLVFSVAYQYAGRMDLMATIDKRTMIVDYKSTLSDVVPYQLVGYAVAYEDHIRGLKPDFPLPTHGIGVAFREDGTPNISPVYELRRYRNEWLSLRSTYSTRRKVGTKQQKQEGQE